MAESFVKDPRCWDCDWVADFSGCCMHGEQLELPEEFRWKLIPVDGANLG